MLEIELDGDLAALMALGESAKANRAADETARFSLVAGTRNQLSRTVMRAQFQIGDSQAPLPNTLSCSLAVNDWNGLQAADCYQSGTGPVLAFDLPFSPSAERGEADVA